MNKTLSDELKNWGVLPTVGSEIKVYRGDKVVKTTVTGILEHSGLPYFTTKIFGPNSHLPPSWWVKD